jgi:hypothetical protein
MSVMGRNLRNGQLSYGDDKTSRRMTGILASRKYTLSSSFNSITSNSSAMQMTKRKTIVRISISTWRSMVHPQVDRRKEHH